MRTMLCTALFMSCWLSLTSAEEDATILASFDSPDSTQNWNTVNDGVMGGLSQGGFRRTDANSLLFKGELSLENNGGFSSIRTKPTAMGLADISGIKVRARGDGRTYWIELRVAGQIGASSYRAFLPTLKGEWKETVIPLSAFKYQAFGRQLSSGILNPAAIASVGFTIADKQAGAFELEIGWIKAVLENDKP